MFINSLRHMHDLKSICTAWKGILSTTPPVESWHDGINKRVLITALLGINKKVHFCCRACHSKDPHTRYIVCAQDLAVTGSQHNPIVIGYMTVNAGGSSWRWRLLSVAAVVCSRRVLTMFSDRAARATPSSSGLRCTLAPRCSPTSGRVGARASVCDWRAW